MTTPDQLAAWVDTINAIGLLGGCLVGLWAFATDRVVAGSRLRRAEEKNDTLIERTFGVTVVAEKLADALRDLSK